MRATARHVHGNLLRDNRLVQVQSLSDYGHILRGSLVNQIDCVWGDRWDEPVED